MAIENGLGHITYRKIVDSFAMKAFKLEGVTVKSFHEHVRSSRADSSRRTWHFVGVELGHGDRLDLLPQKHHCRDFALDHILVRRVRDIAFSVSWQPHSCDDEAVVWRNKLEAAPALASREGLADRRGRAEHG